MYLAQGADFVQPIAHPIPLGVRATKYLSWVIRYGADDKEKCENLPVVMPVEKCLTMVVPVLDELEKDDVWLTEAAILSLPAWQRLEKSPEHLLSHLRVSKGQRPALITLRVLCTTVFQRGTYSTGA